MRAWALPFLVVFQGQFPAGQRKNCQVSALPRPDAAGSIATLMLRRGLGGAYFFALIPLLMLALAGSILAKAWRAQ